MNLISQSDVGRNTEVIGCVQVTLGASMLFVKVGMMAALPAMLKPLLLAPLGNVSLAGVLNVYWARS
jgi:hypothetical protein